jgi:hypothetical protein
MGVGAPIWNRVEAVLESGAKIGLAMTGGGIEVCSWLLNHPGASRAVVEVQVPYHEKALANYLGVAGPHRAEEETARALAARAYWRVRQFAGKEMLSIGVGCTAALATRRQRRGEDRALIALRTDRGYRFFSLHFEKGEADRLGQEEALSRFILQVLGETCGLEEQLEGGWPSASISKEVRDISASEPLEAVLAGEVDVIEAHFPENMNSEVERRGRLLFPGSFNPLHEGHIALAQAAQRRAGLPLCLEISVANVDKPSLAYAEVAQRLDSIQGRYPVVVTRAPTFVEKARLFPGCIFVIGYDTAVRLVEGKYYDEGIAGMEAALSEMAAVGCRFLVAGRLHEGEYRTLSAIEIPCDYEYMFEEILEEEFRIDISSSQLRASQDNIRP